MQAVICSKSDVHWFQPKTYNSFQETGTKVSKLSAGVEAANTNSGGNSGADGCNTNIQRDTKYTKALPNGLRSSADEIKGKVHETKGITQISLDDVPLEPVSLSLSNSGMQMFLKMDEKKQSCTFRPTVPIQDVIYKHITASVLSACNTFVRKNQKNSTLKNRRIITRDHLNKAIRQAKGITLGKKTVNQNRTVSNDNQWIQHLNDSDKVNGCSIKQNQFPKACIDHAKKWNNDMTTCQTGYEIGEAKTERNQNSDLTHATCDDTKTFVHTNCFDRGNLGQEKQNDKKLHDRVRCEYSTHSGNNERQVLCGGNDYRHINLDRDRCEDVLYRRRSVDRGLSQTIDRHGGQYLDRSEDRHGGQYLDRSEERQGGQYLDRGEDRHGGQYLDRSEDRHGGQYLDRSEDRHGGQYLDRSEDRHGGQYLDRSEERHGGQYLDRSEERQGGQYLDRGEERQGGQYLDRCQDRQRVHYLDKSEDRLVGECLDKSKDKHVVLDRYEHMARNRNINEDRHMCHYRKIVERHISRTRDILEDRRGNQYTDRGENRRGNQYTDRGEDRRGNQYTDRGEDRRGNQYTDRGEDRRGNQYTDREEDRRGNQYTDREEDRRGNQYTDRGEDRNGSKYIDRSEKRQMDQNRDISENRHFCTDKNRSEDRKRDRSEDEHKSQFKDRDVDRPVGLTTDRSLHKSGNKNKMKTKNFGDEIPEIIQGHNLNKCYTNSKDDKSQRKCTTNKRLNEMSPDRFPNKMRCENMKHKTARITSLTESRQEDEKQKNNEVDKAKLSEQMTSMADVNDMCSCCNDSQYQNDNGLTDEDNDVEMTVSNNEQNPDKYDVEFRMSDFSLANIPKTSIDAVALAKFTDYTQRFRKDIKCHYKNLSTLVKVFNEKVEERHKHNVELDKKQDENIRQSHQCVVM